ncbi:hypothetical protein EST38_g9035 [Candolleomyces aberdarensis]|uniref:Uncharacterized protein n=1 Tax=Candolleomyces aberdarensis TaxID=2316362 RepID=A0A4V1Q2Z6_9AGAR|nr:hypothetical protein EST38_g9035 [Candolleomyces aberdarensis]
MVQERKLMNFLVALVTLTELVLIVLISENAWQVLCRGPIDPTFILVPPKSAAATPILNGFVALLVQLFFARKVQTQAIWIWANMTLPWVIVMLGLLQFAASIGTTVLYVQTPQKSFEITATKPTVIVQLSGSLACDALIMFCMIGILLHSQPNTALRLSQRLLSGFLINVIENSALTTVCVALNLAFAVAEPRDYTHLAFQNVIGGL